MENQTPAQNINQPQQQTGFQPPQQPPPADVPPVDIPPEGPPVKKILIIVGSVIGAVSIILITFFIIVPWIIGDQEPEEIELTYWGVWDDESVMREVINNFESENPNITVNYEKQDITSLGDTIARIHTRINEGSGPDVYRFHNSWIPQLVTSSNEYLLPLPQNVVDDTGLDSEYYEVVQSEMSVGNAYYGIPLYIDTLALFVNEDMFEDAGYSVPSEWNEFFDVARRLTIKSGERNEEEIVRPGIAMGTYGNVEHADDIISMLLVQKGITRDNFFDNTTGVIAEVLNFYTCFGRSDGSCVPVWDENQQNSKLAFATGQLPMYFGYSYDLLEIRGLNPDLNTRIVKVPRLGNNENTVASYWAEGVSANTEHPEAAFKFIKFLAQRQSLEIIFASQTRNYSIGSPFPRSDMANMLESDPLLATFVEQAPNAKPSLFYSNTHDDARNERLNRALEDAINGIVNDGRTPQTAAEDLIARMKEILGIAQPVEDE